MAEPEESFKKNHLLPSPGLKSPIRPNPPPEFINQTVLTKLWELLHLLFIGIAVSYGLFGRKKSGTENEVETQSKSGEPMVFVSRENCVLEDLGKPKSVMDHKPLSLPIRSLRSKTTDRDAPESVKRNESTSDSDKIKNGKFRGLIPINLEEKFKETVSIPSPVPWGSKSRRMEVRENMNSTSKSHSHSKHISNGESEFDYLKSEAFWSPIFSQTSSMPSQEIRDSKMEDVERGKSSCWLALKLRNGFSIGSFSEMKCDGNLKEFSRSMRDDPLGVDSRKIEVKVKSLRRGKSVRTIRVSENLVFEVGQWERLVPIMRRTKNEKVQDFADSNGVEDEKD
ncbi:hydroxyproline-rich glycoprotein family protein [Actinidia rufa]|uniref:Hydroxyproline-rich glycoprotein family protein n=1 Tax=Actinidia rufa TaxID=165716 RepID=A0A7J0DJL3_9ERIC|nr:hydroxyproline-rich glycoprotein family protein [Actinidia rufa]